MGSRPEQTPSCRTKGPKRRTISVNCVSGANVTTIIVSPKLVRLLVIRGKYLITTGLLLEASFTTERPTLGRKSTWQIRGGNVGRTPTLALPDPTFSWMKFSSSVVYTGRNQLLDRAVPLGLAHRATEEFVVEFNRIEECMATVSSCVQAPGMQSAETTREYPKKIVIRSQSRIFLQTVADIDYLSAAANYVHIHSAGQVFRIRSTIQAIAQRLDPQKFGRVHRCTIVNLERVKEAHALQRGDYLLVLQDGSQLKMSRRHRDKLQKLL